MTGNDPRKLLNRVPAVVFACLIQGEHRIILHPGDGLAFGGAPRDVSTRLIPFELRLPNTLLWAQLNDEMNIVRVWRREE